VNPCDDTQSRWGENHCLQLIMLQWIITALHSFEYSVCICCNKPYKIKKSVPSNVYPYINHHHQIFFVYIFCITQFKQFIVLNNVHRRR
jgi:hypothetical protein